MFEQLEQLLGRRNQRFICHDNEWPTPGAERYTASIEHQITPPLDLASIKQLKEQIGELPELFAFYSRYGSVRLYCDTVGDDSAFYLAHPEEWAELKDSFNGWLENLDESERAELLPEWINDYIVIGEVPCSGNYFLMPLEESHRGKVFKFDHDGFEFIERGLNLSEFLSRICTVTEELKVEILADTRYWDGVSNVSWLVEDYLYD